MMALPPPQRPLTDDEFIVLVGAILLGGPLAAAALGRSAAVVAWAVEHEVLVPPQAAVVLLPGTAAGLDLPRLAILFGVALILAAALFGAALSRRRDPDQKG